MIKFDIPKKPNIEDYNITNDDINDLKQYKSELKTRQGNFNNANQTASNWIGFIALFIIGCVVLTSIEPDVNPIAIIVFGLIIGFLGMIPIGFIIGAIVKSIGDNFAPELHIKEERLINAERYLSALNKYEATIDSLKRRYPKIEEVNFDVSEYNKFMQKYFLDKSIEMIRSVHIDTLHKLSGLKNKCLSSLVLLGLSDVEYLHQSTIPYKAQKDNKIYLVCYENNITPENLTDIIKAAANIQHDYILFITKQNWTKTAWYYPVMLRNKILPIKLDAFEKLANHYAKKDGFTISYNANNTPFDHCEIDFIDFTRSVYGSQYMGFTLQVVNKVFSSKKDIFELIKSIPQSKGTYGIMRYPTKSKDEKSVYGLVFFKMGGEILYFLRYFTAAISDDRKHFSNII